MNVISDSCKGCVTHRANMSRLYLKLMQHLSHYISHRRLMCCCQLSRMKAGGHVVSNKSNKNAFNILKVRR